MITKWIQFQNVHWFALIVCARFFSLIFYVWCNPVLYKYIHLNGFQAGCYWMYTIKTKHSDPGPLGFFSVFLFVLKQLWSSPHSYYYLSYFYTQHHQHHLETLMVHLMISILTLASHKPVTLFTCFLHFLTNVVIDIFTTSSFLCC